MSAKVHYNQISCCFQLLSEFISLVHNGNAVKIILDKKTRKSLGFACIWFSTEDFAQRAVQEMNGEVHSSFFEFLLYPLVP